VPRPPRQMHGRRALAAVAAAGLLVSLFAPWYRDSVVAHGLHGLRTLTVTRSGWDAFSFTEAVVLVAAIVALVIVAAVPVTAPRDGQGRLRPSGALVAALGTIAFVVVLVELSTAPGTTHHALSTTTVAIRWGIFLALACSSLLAVTGLRLLRAPAADAVASRPRGRDADADWSQRTDHASRSGAAARRTQRPPRQRPAEKTRSSDRTISPGPRRTERPRPARTPDRPRWEEGSTGWLDLPDNS
jgi:hypothetical protein